MKLLQVVSLATSLSLNVLLAMLLHSEHQQNHRVNVRLHDSQATSDTRQQTVELLQTKLDKMTEILTNSTARLRAAEESIRGFELAAEEARHKQEDTKRMLAEVPPPSVAVERGSNGKETKVFTFAKLLDRSGNLVVADATFSGLYGRRLVFHSPNVPAGAVAFDVDDLHPAVLYHLSIDADAARTKQERMDIGKRAEAVAGYQAALVAEAERRKSWEAAERVRIEQEKANAELATQQAQQQAIAATAYNEGLKARAAARMADAAMIQALNPQPTTLIQNLNQNRLGY